MTTEHMIILIFCVVDEMAKQVTKRPQASS
jgi:hypothetical protein